MDILISWSGPQSRRVATAFYDWLKEVVPGIRPWISTEDIAPGTSWFASLTDQLETTRFCVICLTPENVRSPWLYFEAGAIASKRADAKVCSYLIGVSGTQLMAGPLSQFQWTQADREGTWKLVREFNRSLPTPHAEPLLESAFSHRWPSLKRKIDAALSEYDPDAAQGAVETEALKPVYTLSSEAETILLETAADKHGVLLMTRTMQGLIVQANGKQLAERANARSEATWQAAVRELLRIGLLENRGQKGEVFGVTAEGFRVADELRERRKKDPNSRDVTKT